MEVMTCGAYKLEHLSEDTHAVIKYLPDQNVDLGEMFMQILNNEDIKTVFQPIISLKDGSVLGHEALSRGPEGTALENPSMLFDIARIHDKLWELEFLCRIKALENASKHCLGKQLFINVDPAVINDDKFKKGFTKDFLTGYNLDVQNIVFEITERHTIKYYKSFRKTIDNYKNQGYRIAIDDMGSGYSGLTTIAEIHPHYIKLDMNLIRNIDKDGLKSALVKTLFDFGLVTDIILIAEGIETEDELCALIDIGIDYGQGYLIQKPYEDLLPINPKIVELIKKRNKKKNSMFSTSSTVFVGDICRNNKHIDSRASGSDVLNIFSKNPALYALPVVDKNKVAGLIMREKFFAKLGTQYGYMLYFNRPVSMLMNTHPLTVDYETKIDMVSKIAITRSENELYDYIIVTKDSKYYGIVTVKDLLEKTIQLEVNYAKHLNPLTGLPGNMLIEIKLFEYISGNMDFTILYIDIDNFKAYNDIYGFENGDKMIQCLAQVISSCVSAYSNPNCFTGHVGGDDFIIATEGHNNIEDLCESIIESFSCKLTSFYSKETLSHGCVTAKNRHGEEEKYGLATLSIACITNRDRQFNNVYELSEYATKVKLRCKETWDNCYLID